MSFFNKIILKMGLRPEDAVGGWKFTLLDGRGALLEGHKGIISYSTTEIIAKLKKGELYILGDKLQMVELNDSELFIKGSINKAERVGNEQVNK